MDEIDEYEEDKEEIIDEQFEGGDDDKEQLVAERNVYDRIGNARPGQALQLMIAGQGPEAQRLEDLNRKVHKMSLMEDEKFNVLVGVHFEKLNEYLKLGSKSLEVLTDTTAKLKDVQHKNPIAYILGYYVMKDKDISKEKLNYIFKEVLSHIEDVKPPDVIRYARLWIRLFDQL